MKPNLKGGNAAVRFLLAHGEKIGMVAIVVCAGMLIWSSIGRERLGEDQKPENLQQLVSQTDTKIKGFRWDAEEVENVIIAEPVSNESMQEIPREGFPPVKHPYDRPVLDPVGKRLDPTLLTVEDLEIHGDSGLWASADPKLIAKWQVKARAEEDRKKKELESQRRRGAEESGRAGRAGGLSRGEGLYGSQMGATGRDKSTKSSRGGTIIVSPRTGAQLQGGEQIKADSWVTVLAKIPIEQQYQLYDDALQNARGYDSSRDIPEYLAYQVQRAEITDAGQGKWEIIAQVQGRDIAKRLDTYPVEMPDPIDPRFNHPVLTHPLPPLILREWDERASHSSMPLLSGREDVLEEEEEKIEDPSGEGGEEDLFAEEEASDRRNALRGRRGSPMARNKRGSSRGRSSMRSPMGRGRSPGGFEGGYGARGGGMEAMYGGMGGGEFGAGAGVGMGSGGRISQRRAGTELATFTWDETTSNLLFRFFDNKVIPGRKYRYRVRLLLKDVNSISSEQYLDKTVADRRSKLSKRRRSARFTDWSKPSPIASVPLPARIYLVSAKPVKEANYNAEPEAELLIKALNSQYAAEIALSDGFSRGSVINVRKKATVIWSNYKFKKNEQDSEFDFRTGITLLDFSGGEKLSTRNRDLISPTRAVLMDASGRLFLQDELEDQSSVAAYQETLNSDKGSSRSLGGMEGIYESF